MTEQSSLSEFFDASALYYQGYRASDIGASLYKIRDDSVKPRHFLGADNADEIEAILTEREDHSLHEIIDGDEPLRPVIDFDLPIETLNAITPKLSGGQAKNSLCCAFRDTCLEIFPEWDKETLTIAESSDEKKISLHVSTFGMRLPNIAQVAMFTELIRKKLPTALQGNSIIDNIANKCSFSLRMLGSPKYNEKTGEHIRVKKAICPKDGTIFDFMIRPPNDESEVIKNSPLLVVLKAKMEGYPSTNNVITDAEFELVETLLQEASIEGYSLSYPSENFPNKFPLSRISPSHCPICDREHDSDHGYIIRNKKSYSFFCYRANNDREPGSRKPSKKLTISETALDREQKFPSPTKLDRSRISDPNDRFVWGDLIDMSTSGRKFSRNEVYEAIQATVACIQTTSRLWVLKIEDTNGGLYFDMAPKLDLAKYEVNLLELGGEGVKLINLIDRAVTKGLILYHNINFLPYLLNSPVPNTKFFNLFIGFLAKPAVEINPEIMDPILWHTKNIISNENVELHEYLWNWWAYLVQKPEKKPRSILVLKSTLQQCGKNIITDFIGDKVLGGHLHYATSDLEKILGRFNSAIQARKLIVMNETEMSSGEWHKFNGHLKSLITEGMVSIERKGIETKRIRDFTRFMVTSNQDAPLKIDIGDSRVVCFDVSSRCRGNTVYFKRLGKVLDYPDAPGVVMRYLLSRDLSDFEPQEIPVTKMKIKTMRDQLPNPIRFIIDYISSWCGVKIASPSRTLLYQKYLEWCGENGEKPFSNNITGKKFSDIGIESKQARTGGGKREWQYILDRSKIVAKLCESGLSDMEEFSDIPQDDLPENETTDIPIFNVPETVLEGPTIPQKIIPPQPERHNRVADRKNKLSPNTSKDKKASNQDDSTQALFDYMAEDTRALVAPTSGTSETSKRPEPVIDEPETCKSPKSIKSSNEVSSTILLARQEREECLRKWAIDHGEDPDVFVTITEKDIRLSHEYRDRMMSDADAIDFVKEDGMNVNDIFYMSRRERLISEEIYLRNFENAGKLRTYVYDDEEWQKGISILQENGHLW
ncbi:highly derived D5-like helicase-primase [Rhizophagus irregularis DAOM 181602=DAOM 197198]|nr:highly derived D5-like helicase-primase [Rhizophagus irregularis DAOM 181602=DAOM 197198]